MRPLKWLEERLTQQGRARQIFLLTDGEISNVTEVLDLCRSMATSTRIFSFGLGKSPSRSLVKGLARATNGRFVFIPPSASVDVYVGEQLQKALQPCLTNVQVKWNLGVEVQHAPKQTPPVYLNDRLVVYALTNDKNVPFDHNSSVELQVGPDHRSIGVARVNHIPSVSENGTIARLAAKALILELQHAKLPSATVNKPSTGSAQGRFKDLATPSEVKVDAVEDAETRKQRIIDLSLKYNILSPHTAFVGVEKRTNASNADMVLREVPIEISADDKHLVGPHFSGGVALPKRKAAFPGAMSSNSMNKSMMYAVSSMARTSSSSLGHRGRGGGTRGSRDLRAREVENRMTLPQAEFLGACLSDDDDDDDDDDAELPMASSTLSATDAQKSSSMNTAWPSNDQDIVRHLINKQKFDGLWNADDTIINKLTGKSLSAFRPTLTNINQDILASVIVIIMLETKFGSFSSLWHGVVQKARKRINDLLKQDANNVDTLIEDILKQI